MNNAMTFRTEAVTASATTVAFLAGYNSRKGARCPFVRGSVEARAWTIGRNSKALSGGADTALANFRFVEGFWSESTIASVERAYEDGDFVTVEV